MTKLVRIKTAVKMVADQCRRDLQIKIPVYGKKPADRRILAVFLANVMCSKIKAPMLDHDDWELAQHEVQMSAARIRDAQRPSVPKPPAPSKTKIAWQAEGVDVASKEFLQTRAWRALRYQAIRRYGARCMCCGASRETGAVINVDHIKPRRHHPELALDIGNLQILCGDCNAGKGNFDETDWRLPADPERTLDIQVLSDLRERGLLH